MSLPESFLFILYLSSCQASRFARNSLPVPDERERERGKRKIPEVTSLPVAPPDLVRFNLNWPRGGLAALLGGLHGTSSRQPAEPA
jgi:hypothetical protein